jgi:hypothetical protein
MTVSKWLPALFGPAFAYDGDLTFEGLTQGTREFATPLPADNRRIVPINIDHRENNQPSDTELAALKRFLRTNAAGVPSIVFWPETSSTIATGLALRYTAIAGKASIDLPLIYNGPSKEAWHDIARDTLSLANRVNNLEYLGVDPRDYEVSQFHTLGDFLREISHQFNNMIETLRQEFEKPLSVIIVFVSESPDPGVLSQLTSPSRYGLLDSHALVSVTSQSEIGKWWSGRRGLLTRLFSLMQWDYAFLRLQQCHALGTSRMRRRYLTPSDTNGTDLPEHSGSQSLRSGEDPKGNRGLPVWGAWHTR